MKPGEAVGPSALDSSATTPPSPGLRPRKPSARRRSRSPARRRAWKFRAGTRAARFRRADQRSLLRRSIAPTSCEESVFAGGSPRAGEAHADHPIIQVWDGVLVCPSSGRYRHRPRVRDWAQDRSRPSSGAGLLRDRLTGVQVVDTSTADHLVQLFRAARCSESTGSCAASVPRSPRPWWGWGSTWGRSRRRERYATR